MKFPTFIKNQNKDCKSSKVKKTINANLGAGQLLLTDSFQPQKKVNNESTPKAAKLPSPLTNLVQVKNTPTTIGTLSKISNKKFECLFDSFTPQQFSAMNTSRCGSTTKPNNPKRLQRNRGLVKSKPNFFLIKSTINNNLNFAKHTSSTPLNLKTAEINSNTQQTPTIFNLNQPLANLVLNDVEEMKSMQSVETQTKNKISASKFSLTKLTKFVSRSALKVIGSARKSNISGSVASSASSNNSSDTSMNVEDYDNDEEELCKENLNINLVKLMDDEERENFEQLRSLNGVKRRPAMGLTAVMLKRLKNNNGSSYSTGYCAPNYYLLGLPIVFNSNNLKQDEKLQQPKQQQQQVYPTKAFARNKTTSNLDQQSNTYDHLNRGRENNTPKKIQVTVGKMSVYNSNKTYSQSASNLNEASSQQLQAHTFDSFVF